MKNFRIILFLLLMIGAINGECYSPQEGKVSLILGPFHYKTNFSDSPQGAVSSYKNGLALIAIGDVSDHGSLEIGVFALSKQFFREYHGGYLGQETPMVHITTGYHFWNSPYLSTSLAFYSEYPIGTAIQLHNSLPPGSEALDTSASDNAGYGIEGAVQGELFNSGKFALVAEIRYAYSLTHKSSERADHYGALVGLRYLIQEDKVHEKPPEIPK